MVNKLQKYIADMDGKSHFGIPEKELFTNLITRLETHFGIPEKELFTNLITRLETA